MSLDLQAIGRRTRPIRSTWTSRDVLLYALAVGAGQDDPCAELSYTTENTEGCELQVLPTFGVTIATIGAIDIGDFDKSKLVHGDELVTVHRPIPANGEVSCTSEVIDIADKGTGALVEIAIEACDAVANDVLVEVRTGLFIRGEGGFAERHPGTRAVPVDRRAQPDTVVTYRTACNQALLYRLCGDRNPLHSDPAFARRGGFDRPILHGLCTYGFAARALVASLCPGDATRLRRIGGRFTATVEPGDSLSTAIWDDGQGEARFVVTRGDGRIVIDRGVASVRA